MSAQITEERAKKLLETLGDLQMSGKADDFPCPRCGEHTMNKNMVRNALSRRVRVMICDKCGMAEALSEFYTNTYEPLTEWIYVTSMLNKHGES